MRIKFPILFLFIFSCIILPAQNRITGRIIDAKNNEPLAFVNIIYNSSNQGTTTDLDGYFAINSKENIEFLKISYLGYVTKTIDKSDMSSKEYLEIKLEQNAFQLDEVTVLPGENPAHRIIDLVIENSKKNNPEKMRSFSYVSYNKMYFTIDTKDIDKITDNIEQTDSSQNDTSDNGKTLEEFFNEQHLLITETVTERRFRYPDNNKEEVLAHRMSGLKTPAFSLLTTQFQSFSFYKDFISLMDKKYLSPISKGSTKKYFFIIEDTMYNEVSDTIFIISYRPLKGKNFEGLQGVLHINSNGYAIQNVSAKPYKPTGSFNINIQQKYEFIDSTQWFPVQLNTDLVMNMLQVNEDEAMITNGEPGEDYLPLIGIGKSYLSDISLNPDYKRRDFNQLDIIVNDDASIKDNVFWNLYRKDSLTKKDIRTYDVIDSIGQEVNLDKALDVLEIIATGYIPIKFVNIDPSAILWFNQYEGYRLGIGMATNERLLKFLSIGAYYGYGFRDKATKYGGHLKINLHKQSNTKIEFGFKQDLEFSDDLNFYNEYGSINLQSTRDFFLNQMDSVQQFYGSFKFTTFKFLQTDLRFNYNKKHIINLDRYSYNTSFPSDFFTSEVGIYTRYAYKEKFIQTPKGNLLSMGTKYPVLFTNIILGTDFINARNKYFKFETKISKKFCFRHIGDLHLTLTGAYLNGEIPYGEMYYGTGSYSWLNINNSFNTMRVNEFISDKFATIFIRHDFGSLLFKFQNWTPKIALVSAAGWGDNSRISMSYNPKFAKTMNKGYFESGIQINQILKLNYQAYGIGIYYRYGPYCRSRGIENWAFKFNLTFAL